MVMGTAQGQVPYQESDGQGAAALSPTWRDYLLTVDNPILVGVKGKKPKGEGFGRDPGSHVLAFQLTAREMVLVIATGG